MEPARPPTSIRSLWSLFALLLAGTLCAAWALPTLGTNDPLWFWPSFQERAQRIVVYDEGRKVVLEEGEAGYEALNRALNRSMARIAGFNESQGLSQDSLQDYYTRFRAVEYLYARPVTIHSRYATGRPDSILVPLSGRHFQGHVFLGRAQRYHPGVLVLADVEEIRRAAGAVIERRLES